MKVLIAAALCLMPLPAIAGQTAERKGGSIMMADYDYALRLDGCTVSGSGDAATVSARLFVRFQPDQRLSTGDGLDFDIAQASPGAPLAVSAHAINTKGTGTAGRGIAPTACAHAINTKGTGCNNGRMAAGSTSCDVAAPVATCSADMAGDDLSVSFNVPLSAFGASAKTGHVTLMKRGADAGGARIAASCSGSGKSADYDLAVLKK